MVLHRSEVKEIQPLAVSQFAMSAANPTPSVVRTKRGLRKKGLMSFECAASERSRLP